MWGVHLCAIFLGRSFEKQTGREVGCAKVPSGCIVGGWMWFISGKSRSPSDIFSRLNLYRRVNRWLRDCLCSSSGRPGFVNVLYLSLHDSTCWMISIAGLWFILCSLGDHVLCSVAADFCRRLLWLPWEFFFFAKLKKALKHFFFLCVTLISLD